MSPLDCDARHYTCAGCERHVCTDEEPSPAEADDICDTCYWTKDAA